MPSVVIDDDTSGSYRAAYRGCLRSIMRGNARPSYTGGHETSQLPMQSLCT
jgi:hypothetical protein